MSNKFKVIISDGQLFMRDTLSTMINLEHDMKVVATADNVNQAYGILKNQPTDIMLMDTQRVNEIEFQYVKKIKIDYPETVMIMLSDCEDESTVVQALSSGVSGYLLKNMSKEEIICCMRDCANGNHIIPSSIAYKLSSKLLGQYENVKKQVSYTLNELSNREKEIASLMVKGMTNKQIAKSSYITEGTVKNYVSDIYSKIGINDRTQAIMFLWQQGLR